MEGKTQQLTVDQLKKYIQTKKDLYEACQRNGYYLPRFKSPMVNEKYLFKVIQKQVWCPKYTEVKLLPCPRRPLKQVLLLKLMEALAKNDKDAGIDEHKQPDADWIVAILSTVDPTNEVFSKEYQPPARALKTSTYSTVELPIDFLDNLPEAKKKAKACRMKIFLEGKSEQRLQRMKDAKTKMTQMIAIESDKLDQIRKKKRTLDLRPQSARAHSNHHSAKKSQRTPYFKQEQEQSNVPDVVKEQQKLFKQLADQQMSNA